MACRVGAAGLKLGAGPVHRAGDESLVVDQSRQRDDRRAHTRPEQQRGPLAARTGRLGRRWPAIEIREVDQRIGAGRGLESPKAPSAHELLRARRNLVNGRRDVRGRVLAVDDSDVFLRVAASVISDTSGLRLIGAVGSGEEAVRVLPQLRPDLVLVDLNMPGMDGVQTTRIIRRDEPRTVVIVISADLGGLSDARAGSRSCCDPRQARRRPSHARRTLAGAHARQQLWLSPRPARRSAG